MEERIFMSDKLRHELYLEAQTNGLNESEYKRLLRNVEETLDHATMSSKWYTDGKPVEDYDEV